MARPTKDALLYDEALRIEDIDNKIAALVAALRIVGEPGVHDLPRLSAMTLASRPGAARRLPMICRLLARRGDPRSLSTALGLSYVVHELERAAGAEAHATSTLLKGICQVGLGSRELGLKSLSRVGAERGRASVSPLDRALREWALVSVAIGLRDLRLAAKFVAAWSRAAERAGLAGEIERAGLVARFLEYLEGTAEAVGDPDPDRVPLLLGLDCAAAAATGTGAGAWKDDFLALCRARRRYPDAGSLAGLPAEELLALSGLMSAWDLAGPLHGIQAALRGVDPDAGNRSLMRRVLGAGAAETVSSASTSQTAPRIEPDAVIWMSDVKGYSTLSERKKDEPDALFRALGPLFRIASEELEAAGGTILEFAGDSILVVFNVFSGRRSRPEEILAGTARCFERMATFGALAGLTGADRIALGVGINRGPVALGYLGGLRRCHLATLGNTVNVAARVEGLTRKLPLPVAVEASFFGDGGAEVWAAPFEVGFRLRDMGRHPIKGISRRARVLGMGPLIPTWVDFVPMGFVATAEPGVVYLDVGSDCRPGIVDHHSRRGISASACELVNRRFDLVGGHLLGDGRKRGAKRSLFDFEFRMHQQPDLDCAASYYSACERLEGRPRTRLLAALSRYVGEIDQGYLPSPEHFTGSLYGVFTAHREILAADTKQATGRDPSDRALLEAGLRVLDAAMFLAERGRGRPDFARIFEARPGWFAEERRWLAEDRGRYLEDLQRAHTYEARVAGLDGPVTGLWLDDPESMLFKHWARTDPDAPGGRGYAFLAVDLCEAHPKGRFVISVDPGSGTSLEGLGAALERAETEKRRTLGRPRPERPRRFPTDNADPWYFGWGHDYTIVDAPNGGTVLTAAEIEAIHAGWLPG
ncbi:MAG TPA: adenylate/guanylate cyclase domain-containing protein [Polyangia bacterium]|nr:adenylate/guanylate cyclase domain-containing protein [Polyangia bacterium]